MAVETKPYVPKNHLRVVTAASLFDGHDAAINIIRRILQGTGVEVVHLGHNRSVAEVVKAAVAEDAHAVGVSCYQGGHVEYFKYMVDLLKERNCEHIKVFGGGGGVICSRGNEGTARLWRIPHLFPRGRAQDGPAGHHQSSGAGH